MAFLSHLIQNCNNNNEDDDDNLALLLLGLRSFYHITPPFVTKYLFSDQGGI